MLIMLANCPVFKVLLPYLHLGLDNDMAILDVRLCMLAQSPKQDRIKTRQLKVPGLELFEE